MWAIFAYEHSVEGSENPFTRKQNPARTVTGWKFAEPGTFAHFHKELRYRSREKANASNLAQVCAEASGQALTHASLILSLRNPNL